MAHPLLYDIRRTLTSKTVLISMALLIGISLLLISSFATTTTFQNNSNPPQILTWYDNSGSYHFLVFETNQFGQGLGGINIQANLTVSPFELFKGGVGGPFTSPQQVNASAYPIYQGPSISTNSSGVAEFTIQVPKNAMNKVNANYTAMIHVNENGFPMTFGGGASLYSQTVYPTNGSGVPTTYVIAPGQVVSPSQYPFSPVTTSKNSQYSNIQVIWAGPYGSVPKGYSVYYQFFNETCTTIAQGSSTSVSCSGPSVAPNTLTESQMNFLGNMTKYDQIFNAPPLESNLTQNANIAFNLYSPNGSLVGQFTPMYSTSQFYPQAQIYTTSGINQIVMGFFLSIFGLGIPLIAILASYNSYGKDRVSGVLESVLAQPISRRGLSISRFFSTFIAMAVAISISMVVVDGIVWYYTKSFVSSTIMLSSAGAFFVELAAFIGIMMLLSRVIKSSGLLVGIGIALFMGIDFFWSAIIGLVTLVTQTNFGSLTYYGYFITGEFVNPAQFVGLIDMYLTHQTVMVGIGGFGGFPITPSQYGITIPSIVITGLLWALIPLVGFLYLAIKHD